MKRVRCDIQYSIHSISQANLCFVGEVLRRNKREMRAQWQILVFFCCNARGLVLAPVDGFWGPGARGRGLVLGWSFRGLAVGVGAGLLLGPAVVIC
ncbi:MAG: hypothetical protein JWQ50_4100 [Caballeronia mineralivorans]|jgi:hypothetical protein|nr:hypothetical protein [Caballeronia mineralivorans]